MYRECVCVLCVCVLHGADGGCDATWSRSHRLALVPSCSPTVGSSVEFTQGSQHPHTNTHQSLTRPHVNKYKQIHPHQYPYPYPVPMFLTLTVPTSTEICLIWLHSSRQFSTFSRTENLLRTRLNFNGSQNQIQISNSTLLASLQMPPWCYVVCI